jgi:hypothetical protein
MKKNNRLNVTMDDRMWNYIKARAEHDGLTAVALCRSLLKKQIDQEILNEQNMKYKFEDGKLKTNLKCTSVGCDGDMERLDGKVWICDKCQSVQEIGPRVRGRLMG